MHSDLYLRQLRLGPMENFVYLVGSKQAKTCMVVDPAWDVAAIFAAAQQDGMQINGVLVTHYHPDHCGGHLWGHDIQGVAELIKAVDVPVYVNKHEAEGVAVVTGVARSAFRLCDGGDGVKLGELDLTTIHTPGHTPGSQCFLVGGSLISGDTLFIQGCGRVDLPGGSAAQLYESLTTKLAKIPRETILYPGHNYDHAPSATMADVIMHNPYMQVGSLAEWQRMFGRS